MKQIIDHINQMSLSQSEKDEMLTAIRKVNEYQEKYPDLPLHEISNKGNRHGDNYYADKIEKIVHIDGAKTVWDVSHNNIIFCGLEDSGHCSIANILKDQLEKLQKK